MKDGLVENITYNFNRLENKMNNNKNNNSSKRIKFFNKRFYGLTPFLFSLCSILMLPVIAWSASVTITWDRNKEPDIAGYLIYYGTQSGRYDNSITLYDSANLPLERSYTVDGLSEGVTYYFVLKTLDQAGQTSNYSAQVSQTIPDIGDSTTDQAGQTGNYSAQASQTIPDIGDSTTPSVVELKLLDNFDRYPIFSSDVNGDGLDDLVFLGHNGTYVALSNGSGFDTPSIWIAEFTYGTGSWVSQDRYPRMLADVNGDGLADLIGFGHRGTYVALSNGSGFDTPSKWIANVTYGAGGLVSRDHYSRMLADVNGDGLADLIGFGHNGTYVELSNGSGFDVPSIWIANFTYGAGG